MMHLVSDDSGASAKTPAARPLITRVMVHQRTRELATDAGRTALLVTHADYIRARHELTGEREFIRQDVVLNASTRQRKARPRRTPKIAPL